MDLRCFQPWFFLQWAAVDRKKHNWLECWGYETVSILNGMSVLTLLPPRRGGHHGRRQREPQGEEECWEVRSSGHGVTTEVMYPPQLPATCTRPKTKSARFSASLEMILLRRSWQRRVAGVGTMFFVEDVTTGRFSML